MKNTDIALIILIASISVVASYLLGNAILGNPSDRVESVSYMEPIGSSIERPDVETFNAKALNPTVEVYVGNCGALEVWNEVERTCKLRPEFGGETEDDEKDKDTDEDEDTDKDTNEDTKKSAKTDSDTDSDTTDSDEDSDEETGGR